jgi:cephalosporin hydroxylase
MIAADPTESSSADPTVEGMLDGIAGDRVVGWAWHPNQPQRTALVELVANNRVIATTSAAFTRPDLTVANKRDGACAFEFPINDRYPIDVPLSARVLTMRGVYALPGGPVTILRQSIAATAIPPTLSTPAVPLAIRRPANRISVPLGHSPEIVGHLDTFGPDTLKGWIWHEDATRGAVSVSMIADNREILTFVADSWRRDLSELRQGDGRCGFDLAVPEVLLDGKLHMIDLRLAGTPYSLLKSQLEIQLERASPHAMPTASIHRALYRPPDPKAVRFSFIVNFYNMQREAQRTLTSLSRSYQHNIGDLAYEVICIDNGSNPPLQKDWIESFGPEFRLIRPQHPQSSPCSVINQVAREANGRYLAVMIDGAHMLTPGILREAMDIFAVDSNAVLAVRHWFVGGDQRWLSSIDYDRTLEDLLFKRIDWPRNGYELFRIGLPIGESPNAWFDGLSESNCLFLPAALYARLGGMDEGFDAPGGGFANLDLFRRAAAVSDQRLYCLVGEATFHQYHGGTTTNVTDAQKEQRVRRYESSYRALRGERFEGISPDRIRLRGCLRYPEIMVTARQRPLFATELGITDKVRPAFLPQHLDHGARGYVQSVYAEAGLNRANQWAGIPAPLAAADLINIQMILNQVRPGCIVTTSSDDGLLAFLDSIMRPLALEATRIVRVTPVASTAQLPPRVQSIIGAPYQASTLTAVQRAIGAEEDVLVLFAPQTDDYLPIESIRTYASFVSYGSYLVFLGTVFGQPWLGYSKYWHLTAIRKFIASGAPFTIDRTQEREIVSLCASGYLKRVRDLDKVRNYDPSLDCIDAPGVNG